MSNTWLESKEGEALINTQYIEAIYVEDSDVYALTQRQEKFLLFSATDPSCAKAFYKKICAIMMREEMAC